MAVRVGVVGTGLIGRDHIRRLTEVIPGAEVVAVADPDADAARRAADPVRATVHASGIELIRAPDVDAVLVASWGPTHEEYVLAAIAAGTPVFCEKPLAPTEAACRAIVAAEVEAGRRLVQVGFMRRYDPAYRALKQVIDTGTIGAPLVVTSVHRNPSVPAHYTRDMAVTDTAVHDFDVVRWLLGQEFTSIEVHAARPNRFGGELRDPLVMLLRTTEDVVVTVETSVNIRYGYDIRGEIVGEQGTAALADRGPVVVRADHRVSTGVDDDWRDRFADAYDAELREWIAGVAAGDGATGPSAWDGYAAQVVCEAGVQSLYRGERMAVTLVDRPSLYR